MDRPTLPRLLGTCEDRIAQTRERIEQQRARVERLEQGGADPVLARRLLHTLQQSLEIHYADRERLLGEAERT